MVGGERFAVQPRIGESVFRIKRQHVLIRIFAIRFVLGDLFKCAFDRFAQFFLVIGFATMAGFLFSHTQGLVNVLWFFAFFVALQFALCLVSGITLVAVLSGNSSASFTFNPARLVYSKSMPA